MWFKPLRLVFSVESAFPGRYLCLGRRIAFVEMRMIIAMLLTKYTVHPAPGEDGTRMHTLTRDQFAAHPGPFVALFKRRKDQ
jgi:cytochrome P450